jgi:hypothetical protein
VTTVKADHSQLGSTQGRDDGKGENGTSTYSAAAQMPTVPPML